MIINGDNCETHIDSDFTVYRLTWWRRLRDFLLRLVLLSLVGFDRLRGRCGCRSFRGMQNAHECAEAKHLREAWIASGKDSDDKLGEFILHLRNAPSVR